MDDNNRMARLLQFLDGEAKQVVSGLETVTGGVHEALQILEQRYGRPCMIVSSVVMCPALRLLQAESMKPCRFLNRDMDGRV